MTATGDRCELRTADGTLLGRGRVLSATGDHLVLDVGYEPGRWTHPGDSVVVEALNPVTGRHRFLGVVHTVDPTALEVVRTGPVVVVQERDAVRVQTAMTHRFVAVASDDGDLPLDPPVVAHVLDVSATGLRFRCRAGFDPGTRLRPGEGSDLPVPLTVQVLRRVDTEHGVEHAARFVDASTREADLMFGFVLAEQRRQLRAR